MRHKTMETFEVLQVSDKKLTDFFRIFTDYVGRKTEQMVPFWVLFKE
jgi:hypothetical protein